MATITFPTGTGNASWKTITGKIVWTESNINVSTNKSTITTKLYCKVGTGGTSGKNWNGYVQVGSNTKHSFSNVGSEVTIAGSWVLLKTYTDVIEHDDNGGKTVTIKGSVSGPNDTSLEGVTSKGSESVSLEVIPRESKFVGTPTCTSSKLTYNYKKYTTDFIDYVSATCAGITLFENEQPTSFATEVTKEFTFTNEQINTFYQWAYNNGTVTIPITITSVTKKSNGSQIGSIQTVTVNYPLFRNSLISINKNITNSSIGFIPNIGHKYLTNNILNYLKCYLSVSFTTTSGTTYTFPDISVTSNNTTINLENSQSQLVFNNFTSKNSVVRLGFNLKTYLNGTSILIGTTGIYYYDFQLPSYNLVGSISATEGNTISGITKASTTFIKGLSKIVLTFQAGKDSASGATSFYNRTVGYKLGNSTITSPCNYNYNGTLPTIVAFTGLNDDISLNITGCDYVAYQFPERTLNVYRSDSSGNAQQSGEHATFQLTIKYFKEQSNPLITSYARTAPTFIIKYKNVGDQTEQNFTENTEGVTIQTSTSGNIVTKTYTKTVNLGTNAYQKSMQYSFSGTDCVNQSIPSIANETLLPGKPGMWGFKDGTTNHTVINDKLHVVGDANVTGNLSATTFQGATWDFNTNNTSDTWIPVASGGTWKHRAIPTAYNSTSPSLTEITLSGALKMTAGQEIQFYTGSTKRASISASASYNDLFLNSNGGYVYIRNGTTNIASFRTNGNIYDGNGNRYITEHVETGNLNVTSDGLNGSKASITSATYAKCGSIVMYNIGLKLTAAATSSSSSDGYNIFSGTISNFTPAIPANLTGYQNISAIIGALGTDKHITVRNCSARTIAKDTTMSIRGIVIINIDPS